MKNKNILKKIILFVIPVLFLISSIKSEAATYSSTDPDNNISITTGLTKGKYNEGDDMYISVLITIDNYYSYEYTSNWTHTFDLKFYNFLDENLSYSPPTLSTSNTFNTSQAGIVIYDDSSYFVGKANSSQMIYTDVNYTGVYDGSKACFTYIDNLHPTCGTISTSKFYTRLKNPYRFTSNISTTSVPINTPPQIFVR